MSVYQIFIACLSLKNGGGRWKMEVEDKWLKNTIFHHVIILIINKLNLKRWKMEDRNAFFVGKCLFTTGLHRL